MRRQFAIAAVVASLASLSVASEASAATEFGSNCTGNAAADNITFFQIAAPGDPLPAAAPVAGVITKWKVNLIPGVPVAIPQAFKVLRLNTAAKTALLVGESVGNVVSGSNTFNTRIPVQVGDRIGLYGMYGAGNEETLYCNLPGPTGTLGVIIGPGAVGASSPYESGDSGIRVPVAAIIEPDADNDGFGDETQDLCPQSAAFQIACPLAALDAVALKPGKRFVKVLVSASTDASVSVVGTVKLGKGAKATLKAGPKSLAGGTIGRFTLRFPGSLKERLQELGPKQKLTLKITASTTNVAGQVSTDKTKAKLKGQG